MTQDLKCNKCANSAEMLDPSVPWKNTTQESKMTRLGISCNNVTNRSITRKISTKVAILKECIPFSEDQLITQIEETDPTLYPDTELSSKSSDDLHATCGRWFELSMLCFQVIRCDYCGIFQPTHSDPDIKYNAMFLFERKLFTMTLVKAWKLNCLDIYKGEQFYQARSRTQVKCYRDHHNNRLPHEVLDVATCDINIYMCNVCASNCKAEELNV